MKEAVYVFSGQGAQSVGMGKDLCEISPAASIIFEKADAALGWSISDICFIVSLTFRRCHFFLN